MNYSFYRNHIYTVIAFISLLFTACKKETEYAADTSKRIVSYAFDNGTGEIVKAVVSGDSLLVYWPSYLVKPAAIIPAIELSENAIISPASGTSVALATGTTYKVTAQDGSTRNYYLKIIGNQPDIWINEKQVNVPRGTTYLANSDKEEFWNLIKDTNQTKMYIIDSLGGERKIKIVFTPDNTSLGGDVVSLEIPDTTMPGPYKLKVISGIRTKISTAFFNIKYRANGFKAVSGTLTVKAGEEFTLSASNAGFNDDLVKSLKQISLSKNIGTAEAPVYEDLATMQLVSNTATTATFRFPVAVLPAGTYTLFSSVGNIFFRAHWNAYSPAATVIANIGSSSSTKLVITN
jgi:hypothetical protein